MQLALMQLVNVLFINSQLASSSSGQVSQYDVAQPKVFTFLAG